MFVSMKARSLAVKSLTRNNGVFANNGADIVNCNNRSAESGDATGTPPRNAEVTRVLSH